MYRPQAMPALRLVYGSLHSGNIANRCAGLDSPAGRSGRHPSMEDQMPNEFDEMTEPTPRPAPAAGHDTAPRGGTPTWRLVARLFAAAGNPLRARLLRCLLRPLGLLGAAGIASGAFVAFIDRRGGGLQIEPEAMAQVSGPQVLELARFVEQVDPQALQQFVGLAANSSLAVATFSASVLLLLAQRLQAKARFSRRA